jgi:hypothetical protein
MQIQIIDVGTPNTHAAKNGRSYQSIEVTYKGADGKVGNKKLMSFSNPDVFKRISTLSKGNSIDVVTTKDDAGYWQWTGINEDTGSGSVGTASAVSQPTTGVSTRVTGSNYETADERAVRQRLIVRQSSLSAAVSILTVGSKSVSKDDVKSLAEELTNWVFEKEPVTMAKLDGAISEIEDDIPY